MRICALSRLDQFFTLPPNANVDVDPEIARQFRRNFTVNVLEMIKRVHEDIRRFFV